MKNDGMKALLISVLLLLGIVNVSAQSRNINGTITAFNKYPLNSALVKAKKSKKITKTDSLGNFSIQCKKKDVLLISADGFITERVVVKNQTVVDCNLILLKNESAQAKAVEKGHMKAAEMEYALEHLMAENNDYSKYQNICDLLQAKYPMVRCGQFEGENRVFIGSQPQSLYAGHYALCVVDGIVTDDITDISPTQVISIEVLSADDAASYGSRGGAGVLEIKLKH